MSGNPIHPTDQELLTWADGELTGARHADIAAHLRACWPCRERACSLEETIADFVRIRRAELDPDLPAVAGPRALLRARLEAEAAQATPGRIWGFARAAAVCFSILATFLLIFELRTKADGPQPDAGLTPGDTRPISMEQVCRAGEAEVVVANIPEETRRKVFSAYGITPAKPGDYEVDYLITPDLGGSDSLRNLWPQPYSARWNAREKDKLEQRLHQMVCSGNIDLATAQHEIAANWIRAYRKYVAGASH